MLLFHLPLPVVPDESLESQAWVGERSLWAACEPPLSIQRVRVVS
jgi:hypothetical protein